MCSPGLVAVCTAEPKVRDSTPDAVSQSLNSDQKKKTEQKNKPHFLTSDYTLSNKSQYSDGLLPYESTPLSCVQLLVHQDRVYFQVGLGSEQPDLVEDGPAHCSGVIVYDL